MNNAKGSKQKRCVYPELDRCLDHVIFGLKRYASLSVLARNIQILGNIIQQKNQKKLKKAG